MESTFGANPTCCSPAALSVLELQHSGGRSLGAGRPDPGHGERRGGPAAGGLGSSPDFVWSACACLSGGSGVRGRGAGPGGGVCIGRWQAVAEPPQSTRPQLMNCVDVAERDPVICFLQFHGRVIDGGPAEPEPEEGPWSSGGAPAASDASGPEATEVVDLEDPLEVTSSLHLSLRGRPQLHSLLTRQPLFSRMRRAGRKSSRSLRHHSRCPHRRRMNPSNTGLASWLGW